MQRSLQKSLAPLDWCLMMSGTWIYVPRNRLIRILVYVHRLLIFCALFAMTFLQFSRMTYDTLELTFGFRHTLKNLFNFLFVVTVVARNDSIRQILQNLQPLITKQDAKKLRKFLLICFFYQILRSLVNFTRYVGWFMMFGSELNLSCSAYSELSPWTTNSLVLFASVIKVIYFAERSSLRQVTENIHNISSQKIYLRIKAFVEIKDKISQKISFLILFDFIFIFVESVVAVLHEIENQGQGAVEAIVSKTFIISHVLTIMEIMILVCLTTKLCHQSKENYERLETKIALTQDTSKWNLVLDKMKTAQHFEYQAFDCFPINKQILSAFTASLITFTVLFAQLVSPNKY